jgi:hypothetical protein
MNKSVVVVGVGEMGSVFARGFLRLGYTVHAVTRDKTMLAMASEVSDPELVLIAVAEADLPEQLKNVPETWKDRLVLLQNELLPRNWQKYHLDPTVISVWFEKKKGQDSKVLLPSPVYGKHAAIVVDALATLDIPARVLPDADSLLHELVLKNVYILTTNIAGLKVGGTVGQLWDEHNDTARSVAADVIRLQEALTGKTFDHDALINGMVEAFNGDLEHQCMGRSAPARLARALSQAEEHNLDLAVLKAISASTSN